MKLIFLLMLSFLFSFSNIEKENNVTFFSFLGYKEKKPVFYESTSGHLIIKLDDKLQIIGNFDNSKKPIFIHDDLIVFQATNQNKYSIILSKYNKEVEFPLQDQIYYISGDDNQIYYTNNKSMVIWKTTITRNEQTNLKGFVLDFENECLYFNKEHNPDLIGANADVFKYDTKAHELIKVANNLSGEMTYILPGGKYIFDKILYGGDYKPSITDINTTKFAILSIEEKYQGCYYSYQDEALIFYNLSTLESKLISIPSKISLTRVNE